MKLRYQLRYYFLILLLSLIVPNELLSKNSADLDTKMLLLVKVGNTTKLIVDGNPLFIPEPRSGITRAANAFFTIKHSYTLGYKPNAQNEEWESTSTIIIQTKKNEFYLVGSWIVRTFKNIANHNRIVGILKAKEGKFEENKWKVIRHSTVSKPTKEDIFVSSQPLGTPLRDLIYTITNKHNFIAGSQKNVY